MPRLRDQFPVLEHLAYLNAGTDGPVAETAVAAAVGALEDQRDNGRHTGHMSARFAAQAALRGACARLLGCAVQDVALTTSTSEGLGKVLAGMGLRPGDEILTGEDEHPGLIGPILAQRALGVKVRTAPIDRITDAVTPSTTVVACSHVSWATGRLVDPALAELDIPVVLDGAQGAGAIAVDVAALGCSAYAAAGQKWLCGADGTGMLYLAPAFRERLTPMAPAYMCFETPGAGWEARLHPDARAHDTPSLGREAVAFTHAAAGVLEAEGWDAVHARGVALAAQLAEGLAEGGRTVAARGATTLVSWEDPEPEATAARLNAAGVVVRFLPGTPYVRASVGAWNDESDLDRLLAEL